FSTRKPTPIGALAKDLPAIITGVAEGSPFTTTAPLTGKNCLYYEHKLRTIHADVYEQRRCFQQTRYYGNAFLATVHDVQIGGFFVSDGTGRAFVMPGGGKTELFAHADSKPLSFSEGGGEEKEEERRIELGDKVCVLGTPRSFVELMNYIRQQGGQKIEAGMLQALMKLESEGADFPCYFAGDEDFAVSGQSYEDSLKRLEGSASGLITLGLLLAGLGTFVFIGAALGMF